MPYWQNSSAGVKKDAVISDSEASGNTKTSDAYATIMRITIFFNKISPQKVILHDIFSAVYDMLINTLL